MGVPLHHAEIGLDRLFLDFRANLLIGPRISVSGVRNSWEMFAKNLIHAIHFCEVLRPLPQRQLSMRRRYAMEARAKRKTPYNPYAHHVRHQGGAIVIARIASWSGHRPSVLVALVLNT